MVYAIFMSIDLIMQIGTRKGHEKRGTLDRFSMPLWTVVNIKVFMFMHWNLMNTFKLISTQRKHFLWNGDSRNSKKPRFPLCNPKCEKGHILNVQWFSDTILHLYKWVHLSVHLFVCTWIRSICWKKAEIKGIEGRSILTDRCKKIIRNKDEKEDQRTIVQNGGRIVGLLALFTPLETVYDRLSPNETLQ